MAVRGNSDEIGVEPRHCGQKVPEALENLNKQLGLLQFQLENSDISGVACKEATRRTTFHVLFYKKRLPSFSYFPLIRSYV